MRALLFALTALLISAPARAQEDDPASPLPAAARAALDAVPSEPLPEPEEHYPTSNEWRHDLFFDAIRDLGGAFVGVGTDQCYTLAAVQNASLLVVVDYDPIVPRVHRMYGVLVGASPTPAELLARFDEGAERETAALLEQALAGDPEQRAIVRTYRGNRGRFAQYLAHVARLSRDGRASSWLSDPALYARVRALFANGRVIARAGDVTGATTLRGVGAALRAASIPVRAIYFSNAEQFFRYTPDFAANLRALPTDARSIVLRTFRHRRAVYPEGDTWHYMVQPVTDLDERITAGYRRMPQIVLDAISARLDPRGITVVSASTPRRYARTP